MSKSKARAAGSADLNFVSSLPLEESVRLVGGLASPQMPVTLTEVDDDNFRFRLVDQGKAPASVEGTLRRWEGTYTRLDCTGSVHRGTSTEIRLMLPILAILAAAAGGLMALMFVFKLWLIAFPLALILGLLLFQGLVALVRSMNDGEYKVSFRERDALFDFLIHTFRNAGAISLDGTRLHEMQSSPEITQPPTHSQAQGNR